MKTEIQRHHGRDVWVDVAMDLLRKDHCLCLRCPRVKTCGRAKELYNVCVKRDLAVMVTRCPDFAGV